MNGAGFSHDVAGGNGNLIVSSMQSPGFLAGSVGWQIRRDGSVEFNNGTFRGTITASTIDIVGNTASVKIDGTTGIMTVTSQTAGFSVTTDGTSIKLSDPNAINTPGLAWQGSPLALLLTGPDEGFGAAVMKLLAATVSTNPQVQFGGITLDLVANTITTDTPHSLGSPSATGYTLLFGRYQFTPQAGRVEVDIQLQANAGGGTAGVYTFANLMGAAYQFAGTAPRSYPLGFNGTSGAGANAGSVLMDAGGSAFPGRVRIDIPGLPAGTVIGNTFTVPLS